MAHKGAYPTTGGWIKPIALGIDKLLSMDRYPSKPVKKEAAKTK